MVRSTAVLLAVCLLPLVFAAEIAGGGQQGDEDPRLAFFDMLLANPKGIDRPRQQPPQPVSCTAAELPSEVLTGGDLSSWNCPSGALLATTKCEAVCFQEPPNTLPYIATCQDDGSWDIQPPDGCGQGCFSGETKVVVQGVKEPVQLQDLRVGQHVVCYDGGVDMLAPGAPRWCEVNNFFRAADEDFPDMVRITFRAADGSLQTTTVSWLHIMHLITDPQPKHEAATLRELGAHVQDIANNVRSGQLIPVPTSTNFNTTYMPAIVECVEKVVARGKYIPAVEHPYLLADGLVHPIWPGWPRLTQDPVVFSVDPYMANAFRHIMHAPLWMTRTQRLGTPGKHAQWDGDSRAPLMRTLTASIEGLGDMPVSGTANFTRTLEWFFPRYLEWKDDSSKAITTAEVLSVWPSLFDDGGKLTNFSQSTQSYERYTACGTGFCPTAAAFTSIL